jgi:hypothetical protein
MGVPMKLRQPCGGDRAGSIFRMYMGGNAIVSAYMAQFEPRSLMSWVASTVEGATLIFLLAIVGAAALLDAVINDFMPKRFHWRVALRQRHFILTVMAFCYLAQLYVAFLYLRSSGLLMHYLWNVFAIMAVAFFDAHQRSKDAACVIVCN